MDVLADLLREMTTEFFLPLLEKEPAELTAAQRLAIALAAGCEVQTAWEGQRLVLQTKYAVSIEKVEGRFVAKEFRRCV